MRATNTPLVTFPFFFWDPRLRIGPVSFNFFIEEGSPKEKGGRGERFKEGKVKGLSRKGQGRKMDSRTVGIVGGGQLGRMMAEAALRIGVKIAVLDPLGKESPAGQVCWKNDTSTSSHKSTGIHRRFLPRFVCRLQSLRSKVRVC